MSISKFKSERIETSSKVTGGSDPDKIDRPKITIRVPKPPRGTVG